jgi:hypothetical protein
MKSQGQCKQGSRPRLLNSGVRRRHSSRRNPSTTSLRRAHERHARIAESEPGSPQSLPKNRQYHCSNGHKPTPHNHFVK